MLAAFISLSCCSTRKQIYLSPGNVGSCYLYVCCSTRKQIYLSPSNIGSPCPAVALISHLAILAAVIFLSCCSTMKQIHLSPGNNWQLLSLCPAAVLGSRFISHLAILVAVISLSCCSTRKQIYLPPGNIGSCYLPVLL